MTQDLSQFERAHAAGIPVEYMALTGRFEAMGKLQLLVPWVRYRFKPGIEVRLTGDNDDECWREPEGWMYRNTTPNWYEWRMKPEARPEPALIVRQGDTHPGGTYRERPMVDAYGHPLTAAAVLPPHAAPMKPWPQPPANRASLEPETGSDHPDYIVKVEGRQLVQISRNNLSTTMRADDWLSLSEPRSEFLAVAERCGAKLTGKPDGSESITVVFTIEAWRAFDAALAAPPPVERVPPLSDEQWRDMASAPLDGTLVRLLVKFDQNSVEDTTDPHATMGHCCDGEWHFVGWNWTHDEWCRGAGDLLGWLPFLSTPSTPVQEGTDQ